jgi:glycerophosphoryl diester phosphodiesterase
MVIIGHRGAKEYAPENTILSIKKAIDLGVDYIEFDVHALKDGSLVVMHDDTLDRTTNGHGFVADKTLDEIKRLDAGMGEHIPTLPEVLDVINKKVKVIIEISGFLPVAACVAKVIEEYVENKGWKYDDFMVSSFNHPELRILKDLLPEVKIGANTSGVPISYAKFAEELGADFLATQNLYLTDDKFVKDAHERGIKFYLYTVNDKAAFQRYENFGIDGIFSDAPDKIAAYSTKLNDSISKELYTDDTNLLPN